MTRLIANWPILEQVSDTNFETLTDVNTIVGDSAPPVSLLSGKNTRGISSRDETVRDCT